MSVGNRGGAMLAAALFALGANAALAATPDRPSALSVPARKAVAAAGRRPVAPARSARPPAATVARGVTYGGSTSVGDPIVIQLARDGRSVRRTGTQFEARCVSGPVIGFFLDDATRLAINARGRFRSRVSRVRQTSTGPTARATTVLKGTVRARTMSGSVRLHADLVNANGVTVDTCEQTGRFTAVSAPGRVFGGSTSQGGPVVVALSANGRSVRDLDIGWRASCTPSGAIQMPDPLTDFRITGRRFGDDFVFKPGKRKTNRYALRGTIKAGRVTGRMRVKTTQTDGSGATTATCDTGTITYRASSR